MATKAFLFVKFKFVFLLISYCLYTKVMNISTRRLLTSITRKIGGFFVCKKFFQEILKKHPPKNALPFQTSEGVNCEPRTRKPFTCTLTTEYIGTSDFSSDDEPPYRVRQDL